MRSRNHSLNTRAKPPKDRSLRNCRAYAEYRATKNNSALNMLSAIGRSARGLLVHICSPRTLRVAHEELLCGGGNKRGFSKNQAPTRIAWRQLRFQTGRYTRGLVNTLVHTLQGFECLFHDCLPRGRSPATPRVSLTLSPHSPRR